MEKSCLNPSRSLNWLDDDAKLQQLLGIHWALSANVIEVDGVEQSFAAPSRKGLDDTLQSIR